MTTQDDLQVLREWQERAKVERAMAWDIHWQRHADSCDGAECAAQAQDPEALDILIKLAEGVSEDAQCAYQGTECDGIGVFMWSDADGIEIVCPAHKDAHFYAHGPEEIESRVKLREALTSIHSLAEKVR